MTTDSFAFTPLIITGAAALAASFKKTEKRWDAYIVALWLITLAAAVITADFKIFLPSSASTLIIISGGLCLLLSAPSARPNVGAEPVLLLLGIAALCGLTACASSSVLLLSYVTLGITTAGMLYLSSDEDVKNFTSRLKYTALFSALLGGGLVLLTVSSATGILNAAPIPGTEKIHTAGIIIVSAALFFQAGILPFNLNPASLSRASWAGMAFICAAAMPGTLAALQHYFVPQLSPRPLFDAIAAISALLPAILGLFEKNMKRFLALTTCSCCGWLLGAPSHEAFMVFCCGYVLSAAGLFAALAGKLNTDSDTAKLDGLWRKAPFAASAALLSLMSLGAVAPLPGFIGKFEIFRQIISSGKPAVIIAAYALAAVLTTYSCLRIGGRMFFRPAQEELMPQDNGASALISSAICAAALVALSVFPQLMYKFAAGTPLLH